MGITLAIYVFIFGALIGSFLNVVIFRLRTHQTVTGRSCCMSCGKSLRWFELIPVLSFLVQRGRCRRCQSTISLQYPIVELFTAVLFLLIFWRVLDATSLNLLGTAVVLIFSWVVASLLIVITVYDFRHKIIPNPLVYTFIVLAFSTLFVTQSGATLVLTVPSVMQLLSGIILALPFILVWLLSRGTLMGLGDGKLMVGIGYLLGLLPGIVALLIAFWAGAVVTLLMLLHNYLLSPNRRTLTMKSEIPFGPFLLFGLLIVYLFNLDLSFLMYLTLS